MARANNRGVIVKPRFDGRGGGGFVFANPGAYTVYDPKGNVVDTGEAGGPEGSHGYKAPSQFISSGQFGPGYRIVQKTPDGELEYTTGETGRPGARYDLGLDGYAAASNKGAYGTAGGMSFGSNISMTPGGTGMYVNPSFVDYGSLAAPFVDFQGNVDRARTEGKINTDLYIDNINRAKDPALGLVDTDLEGINRGLDRMIPRYRTEGNLDQLTNIDRAGMIDQANINRIPGMNTLNRTEIAATNEFNQSQRDAAVEASGLDFRKRINEQISNLSDRARTGRLQGDLDTALSMELANRGSDLARSTGVGSLSPEGVRANDRATISERVNLALGAEGSLLNALQLGQSVLSAPEERAPTLLNQPQQIAANVADVASRLPLTSSISAGAAQQGLASEMSSYQLLPAQGILSAGIQTDMYNETGKYNRDLTVLDRTQAQMTAADTATQGAINADTAFGMRQQQYGMWQQGFNLQERAQTMQGIGLGAGILQAIGAFPNFGGAATQQGGSTGQSGGVQPQNPLISGIMSGVRNLGSAVVSGIGGVIDGVSAGADAIFGDGDGRIVVGETQIDSAGFNSMLNSVGEFFTGATPSGSIGSSAPANAIGSAMTSDGQPGYTVPSASDQYATSTVPQSSSSSDDSWTSWFKKSTAPAKNKSEDLNAVANTASAVSSWNDKKPHEQLKAAAEVGNSALAGKGVVSEETLGDMRTIGNSLTVLADPNASDAQRASAIATAGASLATHTVVGNLAEPRSIGGRPVIGTSATESGQPGFMVQNADGSTEVISQSAISNSQNSLAALRAFSVLTSNADNENKLNALATVGVTGAAANNLITQVAAGNSLAGLSIFSTSHNWDQMSTFDRAVSTMQTSSAILQAAAPYTASQAVGSGVATATLSTGAPTASTAAGSSVAASTTATTISSIATNLAGAAGVAGGAYGMYQTAMSSGDASSSQQANSVIGATASGTSIGAGVGTMILPGVGTLVGAGIGALMGAQIGATMAFTGSGKGTGQMMRDGWRNGLERVGVAEKNPKTGRHEIELADGTKYDIGLDGGAKLPNKGTNIDGKNERFTYDVDWSNPTAVETIPDAHLFAIATGLDPTSNKGNAMFDRIVGQTSNAITSNVSNVDGARANVKAMLDKAQVSPENVAMRLETLRVTNKISEQEYNVYLDRTNKMFGTKITAPARQDAVNAIVSRLQQIPKDKIDKPSKQMLETLTDPKKLAKAQEKLEQRMEFQRQNLAKDPRNKQPRTITGRPAPLKTRTPDQSSNMLFNPDELQTMPYRVDENTSRKPNFKMNISNQRQTDRA